MAGYWHPEIERMFTEQKARDERIFALLEQSAARDRLILRKLDKIYGLLAAPARMFLTIEGDPEMPLTVDSANAVAILSFTTTTAMRSRPRPARSPPPPPTTPPS